MCNITTCISRNYVLYYLQEVRHMKVMISNGFPQLIGKGQHGIWRVTATHQDGRVHFADYEAFTMCEARRRYLMEFGPVRGEVHAKFIQKTP